jgi:predicted FMN-binding regulatory protein PaiB
MYVPRHNQTEDRAALLAYMRAYCFAALATAGPAGPMREHNR